MSYLKLQWSIPASIPWNSILPAPASARDAGSQLVCATAGGNCHSSWMLYRASPWIFWEETTQQVINLILSSACSKQNPSSNACWGPGDEERYFLREWTGEGGSGRGVCFGISAAILSSSNQPGSCQHCPPAVQGTLFGLEAPGCAHNKTQCLLRAPSTSLHSSDNSLPVPLTLAAFPSLCQAADLGHGALLSHPIASHPGLSVGHHAPHWTFWAPELGT